MQQRYIKRALLGCLSAAIWWGCNENVGVSGELDVNPPNVLITLPDTFVNATAGLQFNVSAADNISLLTVGWSVTGAVTFDTVVTFTETTPSFSEDVTIFGFTSGTFEITATATDGSGNEATPDTATARVFDLQLAAFVLPDPAGPLQAARVGGVVRVQLQATNSDGLSKITLDGVAFRGSSVLGTDTVVQRFEPKIVDDLIGVTDTLIIRDLIATEGDLTVELATLRGVVEDARGNVDTAFVQIQLTSGPELTVTSPSDSAQVAPGFNVGVEILAEGMLLAEVGFLTTGIVIAGDTSFFVIGSQPDTTSESFILAIPAGTAPGFITLFPVGQDSAGNLGTGFPITIEVVAAGGVLDTEPPLILDSIPLRAEVDDQVLIKGTDLGGITRLGYIVSTLAGAVVSGDSTTFGGTNTNEEVRYLMRLDTVIATFPTQYVVTTFGLDGAANRGANSVDGLTSLVAPGQADTVTVVAGRTKVLPTGGAVADGIVNRNLGTAGEIYLTNVALDQLEVFDIATRSFGTAIPIGAQPVGIALWPSDTLGANANIVMVANSGGTNISIVNVAGGFETRRHALPNFIIHTVETALDEETAQIIESVIRYDFSDRPQYIGATCRPTAGLTTCAADSIYAVYSTTPTAAQPIPLPNRGSMRWENLTACDVALGKDCFGADGIILSGDEPDSAQSHFFFEHAQIPPSNLSDTLRVFAERSGVSEILLYAEQGITIDLFQLAFGDTTYVRNSGNFTHSFVGEGGDVGNQFARVLSYDGNVPIREVSRTLLIIDTTIVSIGPPTVFTIDTTAVVFGPSFIDDGVSRGTQVTDFVTNTAMPILSIGTNFNGLTNLVRRTDSIYVVDEFLRLVGTIDIASSNYGMDLNFDHAFAATAGGTPGAGGGAGDPDDRILFAATDNPEIVAYDTWFYGEIESIPIRDPIIGPLRMAELPSGEQFLVGVTAFGVVTVQLPPVANIFPSPSQ